MAVAVVVVGETDQVWTGSGHRKLIYLQLETAVKPELEPERTGPEVVLAGQIVKLVERSKHVNVVLGQVLERIPEEVVVVEVGAEVPEQAEL